MYRIALKMLMGDRGKYLSLVIGLSFAVFLITQQGSIFLGLMLRASGFLQNIGQPDLWVANPYTEFVGDVRPLRDDDLYRVRSVPGVAWAEPFLSARARVDLPDGSFKTAQLIGIPRASLIGQPDLMIEGHLEDLRSPDAVLVEESSRARLGGVGIGDVLRLNDRRAVVVGFFRAKLGFESNAMVYSTYENALTFTPLGRERLSFILVKTKSGADLPAVQRTINELPDVIAMTRAEFLWKNSIFILRDTGIGINFGITVLLGFIVGLVVAAATLYQFTVENLRHFAVLKAMGASTATLVRMILLQALTVGFLAYGIGAGLAGAFSLTGRRPGAELATHFPWQLMVASLVAMLLCVSAGSLLSLRRVVVLEPAIVFK